MVDSLSAVTGEAGEDGLDVAALEKEISELKAKKAAALESEDYDEAKNIKDKIDTLAEKMDNE